MKSNNKGFTLVELSIVIVIIGLIVAGVTAGQSLVKGAQLRSVLTQADQVRAAINAFRLQYNGLPGDITNASSYWPTSSSTTTFCSAAATTPTVANDCDGNGDKMITVAAGNTGEQYMAWYHLARAGLFSGSFVPGAILTGTINTNIPPAKYPGAGITLGWDANGNLGANAANSNKNVILFGAVAGAAIASGPFLSSPQASSLDVKADDGDPFRGSVLANGTGTATAGSGCGDTTLGNVYNLSSTTVAPCAIEFIMQ